jgi:hypothetical protein
MLVRNWAGKIGTLVPIFRALLLGFTGLFLCGCVTQVGPDRLTSQPQDLAQEKSAAAAGCNQEIDALRNFVASRATKSCVEEKIIKPLTGICATNGLSRECIFALDESTSCLPNGPELPECDRLAKMENQFGLLGAYGLEGD